MEIINRKVNELIPYVNNTRTHSDEQVQQIASSIKEFGFTNAVLLDEKDGVIAGHGRIMAAKLLQLDEIPTVTLTGLTEAQIKAYIIADNKLALNAGWDEELLKVEIEALQEMDFNIDLLGFNLDELNDLEIGDIENEDVNPYSQKVEIPTYIPSDEIPDFSEMFNPDKSFELINKIDASSVDNEIKIFLKMSAYRHTIFNYEKIADFYSNADKETQELMEDSALVLIDINKAIEKGFVKLSDAVAESYMEDYNE